MTAETSFGYYYGGEIDQFSFYRIPRQLITGDSFKRPSTDAKLLYGLLLDRMILSAKNGWYDEAGCVHIYYTLGRIQEDTNCGHDKAVKRISIAICKCDIQRRISDNIKTPIFLMFCKKCQKISILMSPNTRS